MSITALVVEFAVDVIRKTGYTGIFALMVLESALMPVPSEAVMPFAGFLVSRGEMDFWTVVFCGTLGNLVGSVLAYFAGKYLGRPFLLRYGKYLLIDKKELEFVDEFFKKNGDAAIFVGRMMPVVRTIISFPSGIASMNFLKFTLLTFAGSIPWNAGLTYVGIVLEENWEIIESYSLYVDLAAIVIALLVLALLYKRKKSVY